jgi:hypothetical protein
VAVVALLSITTSPGTIGPLLICTRRDDTATGAITPVLVVVPVVPTPVVVPGGVPCPATGKVVPSVRVTLTLGALLKKRK